jgi:hypothetical protein
MLFQYWHTVGPSCWVCRVSEACIGVCVPSHVIVSTTSASPWGSEVTTRGKHLGNGDQSTIQLNAHLMLLWVPVTLNTKSRKFLNGSIVTFILSRVYVCDYRQVLDWWLDLLTTYTLTTHDYTTLHYTICFLEMDFNEEIFQLLCWRHSWLVTVSQLI